MTRKCLLLSTFLTITVASPASSQLRLDVDPPNPLPTDPVMITVSNEFGSTCYEVCDVSASWVNSTTYHIDWYIRHFSGLCATVITTLSSQGTLGALPPENYLVTVQEYVTPVDFPCSTGSPTEAAFVSFWVGGPPVPTVPEWGLIALVVVLLTLGMARIHRRLAGAGGPSR